MCVRVFRAGRACVLTIGVWQVRPASTPAELLASSGATESAIASASAPSVPPPTTVPVAFRTADGEQSCTADELASWYSEHFNDVEYQIPVSDFIALHLGAERCVGWLVVSDIQTSRSMHDRSDRSDHTMSNSADNPRSVSIKDRASASVCCE